MEDDIWWQMDREYRLQSQNNFLINFSSNVPLVTSKTQCGTINLESSSMLHTPIVGLEMTLHSQEAVSSGNGGLSFFDVGSWTRLLKEISFSSQPLFKAQDYWQKSSKPIRSVKKSSTSLPKFQPSSKMGCSLFKMLLISQLMPYLPTQLTSQSSNPSMTSRLNCPSSFTRPNTSSQTTLIEEMIYVFQFQAIRLRKECIHNRDPQRIEASEDDESPPPNISNRNRRDLHNSEDTHPINEARETLSF